MRAVVSKLLAPSMGAASSISIGIVMMLLAEQETKKASANRPGRSVLSVLTPAQHVEFHVERDIFTSQGIHHGREAARTEQGVRPGNQKRGEAEGDEELDRSCRPSKGPRRSASSKDRCRRVLVPGGLRIPPSALGPARGPVGTDIAPPCFWTAVMKVQ